MSAVCTCLISIKLLLNGIQTSMATTLLFFLLEVGKHLYINMFITPVKIFEILQMAGNDFFKPVKR